MADCNEEFKYLNLFSSTGVLPALLHGPAVMPGSCVVAWGALYRAMGGQGAPTCQHGLWGETLQRGWALGKLCENKGWHCSQGHPRCCLCTLMALPFLPLLSCVPSMCPHPCREHASRLSCCGGMGGSWHSPHTAGQPAERQHILMVFARRTSVCRRKGRVALFLAQAGCQLCK